MSQWDDILSASDRAILDMGYDVRKPTGFGRRPALLVIDMNEGAVGENRPLHEQIDRYPRGCGVFAWRAMPYIKRLIAKARELGIPIVYSRHVFKLSHDLPRARDPKNPFSELSPLSQIHPEIAPRDGDIIIEKTRASVFFGTPLLYILMSKRVDTLIVVGNSTSGCIHASVVDASYYPIFQIVLAEEGIFDRFEASHKASLFNLQLKYGDLVSTDAIIEHLSQVQNTKMETTRT